MRKRGSQTRETLGEADVTFVELRGASPHREMIVIEDGQRKLYAENDHYAGHVLEHEGVGYEFVRTIGGHGNRVEDVEPAISSRRFDRGGPYEIEA
jgi:hypothetical protein